MDLEEIVVEAAATAHQLEEQQRADEDAPPQRPRLRRRSMTMAEEQVLLKLQPDLDSSYQNVYSDWQQSSVVDLSTHDEDLLAGHPLPVRRWAKWAFRGACSLVFVGCCVAVGILAPRSRLWRWPAWVAGSLAAWAVDSWAFWLLTLSIEQTFSTSQRVIYYLQGARRPAERLLAASACLAIFCGLFQPFRLAGSSQALKALVCLALAALGLLLAQVLTKVLAAHFHRKGFFDRLKKALQDEYYLMALSKPRGHRLRRKSWTEQMFKREAPRQTKLTENQLKPEDPKLLRSLEAAERHVRRNRLKLVFDRCSDVKDTTAAKQLAFYIFWNVMEDKTREWLVRGDLAHFLPEAEVDGAFHLLDEDGDGRPTWQECRSAVTAVFDRRQQLAASLQDTDSIIGTLHTILVVLVQIIFFFIYLLVWQVDVVHVWLTFSSIALAFTFIFGGSIKTAYENVMFLFMVHPFDVGDRLIIDDATYTVHKLKLSTTILEKDSGVRVWFPNNKLAGLPIYNQSRAEVVRETFQYAMDNSTDEKVFSAVEESVTGYINHHRKDFDGPCSCVTTAALDPLKLRLTIGVTYSFNATQGGRLSATRHGLILAVTKALVSNGARYSDPQIPGVLSAAVPRAAPPAQPDDDRDEE